MERRIVSTNIYQTAIFLPVERFQKASKNVVWAESRKASR